MLSTTSVSRYGARTCNNVPFIGDQGKACCQTDLCNHAPSIYQMPLSMILSSFVVFFEFQHTFFLIECIRSFFLYVIVWARCETLLFI